MNTIKLNTIGTPCKAGGSGNGGGGKSNYKYYDCSNDALKEINHGTYLADSVKIINTETNEIMIAPEAYFDEEYRVLAVAYDMSKRVYVNGEWIDIKAFIEDSEGFDFSAHIEITEEEFYHIPEDVVLKYRDYEKLKEVFERVYNTLATEGVLEDLPVDLYWYSVPKVNFPISKCGYKSISAETNAYGDVYGSDIIGRVWKQTYEFSSNDFWFDYDKDENFDYSNVEATYFEVLDTNYALCKIQSQDGSAKYILRILM